MGITSRKAKHSAKMARRRDIKAKRRAKYSALAGTSARTKRQNKGSGRTNFKHSHIMANCGNSGCQQCCPRSHKIKLAVPAAIEVDKL